MNWQNSGQIELPFIFSEFVDDPNAGFNAIPIFASRKVSLNGLYRLKLKGISSSTNCWDTSQILNLNYFFNLQINQAVSGFTFNPGFMFHLEHDSVVYNPFTPGTRMMNNNQLQDTSVLAKIDGTLNLQLTCGRGSQSYFYNWQTPETYPQTNLPITYPLQYGGDAFLQGSVIFVFEYTKVLK